MSRADHCHSNSIFSFLFFSFLISVSFSTRLWIFTWSHTSWICMKAPNYLHVGLSYPRWTLMRDCFAHRLLFGSDRVPGNSQSHTQGCCMNDEECVLHETTEGIFVPSLISDPVWKMSHILAAWYNAFKWQKSAHESSFTLLIIINYSYIQNALAHKLQRLGPYIISHCYCFHSHWVNAFLVHKEPTVVQTAFCFPALLKEATVIQANLIKGLNRRAYYR